MRINQTHRILLTLCLIVASAPRGASVARSGDSVAFVENRAGHVTVRAAGRGTPFLNLQDGREMRVMYRGDRDPGVAILNRTAQSRSLASADFDHNGTPDVVVGYADSGGGLITLQRGNPDAFAPTDDAVFVRLQQGYDPPALLPAADVYRVPVAPDFLVTGNFNGDSNKDVLIAAQGGGLYLLAGDGRGSLDAPQPISLPGTVTALAAGQFRAADVFTDLAVGVSGADGHALLIFDDAERGFTNAVVLEVLAAPATAIEFGGLDNDPFLDVAVAAGNELLVVHGWGRKSQVTTASRVERVPVGGPVRGLAVGEFAWERAGHSEIAALSEDGAVHILQNARADTRPFSAAEAAARTKAKISPAVTTRAVDIESLPSWQQGHADRWRHTSGWLPASDCDDEGDCEGVSEGARPASATRLLKSHLSYREMHDLMVIGGRQSSVEIMHPTGPADAARRRFSTAGETPSTILEAASAPVAVLALPRKLNGVTDVLLLGAASSAVTILPFAPNTTITVDRTDDTAAASACTAAGNDCSLRGALAYANTVGNENTTIILPANTYVLSINGTSTNGCTDNSNGDLSANQSMTIVGAGSATTIIRQTGNGPASDGDRIMCMSENFAENLIFNFSGITFTGGRDGADGGVTQVFGGGGIIGGERENHLTLTNVVMVNNWTTGAGLGGGAIEITGGHLTITNSTFGGSTAPGLYTDRASVTNANRTGTSGAGVSFTPSSPMHTGGTGILTVTGSTFTRNVASSIGAGGGGADLYILAFAAPGGIGTGSASFSTTTFSNNQAANGGGILVESLGTTVATTSFTNNSASNRGGAIYVAGASLHLNGASPSVTMTGNTATNAGTSISTASAVTVSGTNVTLGGSIEITTGGSWTNNAGSTVTPTDVVVQGGTFNMNNSTMNVTGNLTIAPAAIVGSTFNGNTGTVNLAGNFSFTTGGTPNTALNAGTGTFNFNGTSAQSITNTASITFNNLTNSNVTQPLTLNNSLAVNGTLNVNGANAILSPVAAAVISGTGTLTGTGTARVSRIAATADFLTQYSITNKTLTNLLIDYTGAGNQTVSTTPYSRLAISGSGTKTLAGNTAISGNLAISSTLASGNFTFSLGGNWTNTGTFTPGTGTVTFAGTTGVQTLSGSTTFFNLTLNNSGATTSFGATTTTIGNDLTATAGTMDGGTSTIIFTGVTDNAGAIAGVNPKNFHNLQINSPATISNTAGGAITIENNYTNAGTFTQAAAQSTIFDIDNAADGAHTLSGAGATTFGNLTINAANTVNAGTHNVNVVGASFTSAGTFTGATSTVTFNGSVAQTITGDGAINFGGLTVNNVNGVQVANGANAVDASIGGILTLSTDLTVVSGAILQQSGTSAGAADVLGTVRRTDLGGVARSFGNVNNQITINSGTAPTQLDFNVVKATPGTFPAAVRAVPRHLTLTPTGGVGMSATVRLRYIDPAELSVPGILESRLVLWKNISGTWTPQGGTPDVASNFVTQTGVTSFSEWAIAEGADLTLTKANNVAGTAVTGQAWNWTLTATNVGAPATFTAGQTIISDNLPNSNLNYGTPTVQNVSNVTGSANISCAIVSSNLACTATGGSVTFDSNIGASSFAVVVGATPQAAGSYQNPRTGGGIAQIDPANVIAESNETNNSPANNTVTVSAASTTTTIASDTPDPSVVGQAVTVQWSVTVNAPGSIGAALTGNVTVSDGTNQCIAAVSAGQCDVTFTSPGAKNITATYAGDANYNGSATAAATTHQVNQAATTTTITSDAPDPSTPGQSIIVQWTVTVNAPGAGTPTGTVTVSDGVDSCNAAVATGQCTVALNTGGTRTLTATYPGDTNFTTSNDTDGHQVCASSLVTATADSGAGSLRQIIAGACDGAVVTFDSAGVFATPQTITLTTGEIVIDKSLTINAGSSQVTVSGNNASRVFNVNAGRALSLVGLTISGGQTAASGGAILNDGTLTVVNSTLSGNNAATDGGAIGASASATSVTLINTTISGNNANDNGGGIAVLGGTFTSINGTIANNRADNDGNTTGTGGGVFHGGGTTTLHNTIVAGNVNEDGASDAADDIAGTVDAASSFNLIGTGGSGGLTNGVNNNQVNVASPGLGPLANNGGRTQTHALLSTSPAIEAGSNANLPADTFDLDGDTNTAETLPLDQRGFARLRDAADADTTATVDIGAYEADPTVENIGNQSTLEETPLLVNFRTGEDTIAFDSITATSSDTTLVPNANLVLGGVGLDRTLTITPVADLSGVTTITVTVQKTIGGTILTMADTFDVTVIAANDPPTLGPIANPAAILEDAAAQSVNFGGVSAGGGESQTLVVTAVSDNTALIPNPSVTYISPNATGSLGYTPVANAFGSAIITVTVSDGLATAVQTFTVTVTAANDPPTIGTVANQTVDEDTATNPIGFTIADVDGIGGQTVTASSSDTTLVPNANLTLGGAGASRTIVVTPAADRFGSTVITLTVDDGIATASTTFTVTVGPINDPPTINAIANPAAILEDAAAQSVNFGGVSAGGGETQALAVTAVSDNTALIPNPSVTYISPNATGSLGYTPVANAFGSATITVTVSDGLATAVQTFTVTVTAANDPPTIGTVANQTVDEDTATNPIGFTIADVDGIAGQTVTASSSDTTLVPNANLTLGGAGASRTIVVTPAADRFGSTVITLTVDDGIATASTTFTVTVGPINDPPTINPIANPAAIVEDAAAQSVNFGGISAGPNEAQALVVTAVSDNTALIPNPSVTYISPNATGSLGYTPVANAFGSATITVTVSDGVATATRTFTVTVNAADDPPTIGTVANQTIDEDTSTNPIAFTIGDVDGLAGLSVTASSSDTLLVPNANLVLGGSGANRTIVVTPAANRSGSSVITLTVNDGTATATSTFTVTVTPIDDPPTLDSIADPAAILEDAGAQSVPLTGIGAGGIGETATLSVTAQSSNTSVIPDPTVTYTSPNATGSISYTPVADASGSAVVTVTVSDGVLTVARTFTVTVTPANDAPTIGTVANQVIDEDTATGPIGFTINDVDGLAGLSVTASSSDTTLVPNANLVLGGSGGNRTIVVTPATNRVGSTVITLTVNDGTATASTTFTVTVAPIDDPPTLDPIGDPAAILEDAGAQNIPLTGIGAGGIGETATLSVTALSSNPGVIPNPTVSYTSPNAIGSISYTPVANANGSAVVTVTVSDGVLTATRSFTVTVTAANDVPTIGTVADQVIDEDTATSPLPFTISDIDGLAGLTVTAASSNTTLLPNANLVLGGTGANRVVTATPDPDRFGSTTITLTVNDGTSSASSTFVLTVNGVNDPPSISAIADQTATPGTRSIGPLPFTIGDNETAASALVVSATSSNVSIVPQSGIVLGGAEAARTITLAIPELANGSTEITVAVSDGTDTTPRTFRVTVNAQRVPSAPVDLSAVVLGQRVDLSWRIPPEDGAADHAATGFRVEVGTATGLSNVATFTTGVTTTFTIADVGPGTYFVRVRGVNAAGVGNPSNEVQATITREPGPDAPQRLRATITGSTVQVDWEAPLDGLPVDGYRVEASYLINQTNIGVADTLAPQLIVPGVPNGVYYARVRGIRANTLTSSSNEIVVLVGPDSCTAPPAPPAGINIGSLGNFVAARWLAPPAGQPVERYILSVGSGPGLSDRGAFEFNAATTSAGAVVADGTYVVRVAAANRCGTSVPTAEASITVGGPPPQLPGPPEAVTATVTGSTVRLDWVAPTTGGAATRYIIEVTTVGGAAVATLDTGNLSTTFTYDGAPAGAFVVRVRGANGAGAGPPSPPVTVTVVP